MRKSDGNRHTLSVRSGSEKAATIAVGDELNTIVNRAIRIRRRVTTNNTISMGGMTIDALEPSRATTKL